MKNQEASLLALFGSADEAFQLTASVSVIALWTELPIAL